MTDLSRGKMLFNCIVDDVDRQLNPDGDECWHCGGEGETFDCIDGCCEDAESGCELCAHPCPECRIHEARRARVIREAVIASDDTGIAIAWLKSVGRWSDDIPVERVEAEMAEARRALESSERSPPPKDGG